MQIKRTCLNKPHYRPQFLISHENLIVLTRPSMPSLYHHESQQNPIHSGCPCQTLLVPRSYNGTVKRSEMKIVNPRHRTSQGNQISVFPCVCDVHLGIRLHVYEFNTTAVTSQHDIVSNCPKNGLVPHSYNDTVKRSEMIFFNPRHRTSQKKRQPNFSFPMCM